MTSLLQPTTHWSRVKPLYLTTSQNEYGTIYPEDQAEISWNTYGSAHYGQDNIAKTSRCQVYNNSTRSLPSVRNGGSHTHVCSGVIVCI